MSPEHKKHTGRRVFAVAAAIVMVLGGGIAATAYIAASSQVVYIDKATIDAPVVTLSPTSGGILNALYVTPGQIVPPNTVVAQVGVELIKSTAGGLVLSTNGDVGKNVPAGQEVVQMVDPSALRVVGQAQEDKGLKDIRVGQRAQFTVDAFGGQTFAGVVDEISPASETSDVVFSVSDQRQEQNFDVKIKFDTQAHPELKQGMSAKIWIYKR